MLEVYWGFLIAGLLFGAVALIFGEVIGHAFDGMIEAFAFDLDFLNPMTIGSAVTVFGGAGIMLSKFTSLAPVPAAIVAACIAIAFSVALFFVYVKPMKNSESSIAFSMAELVGKMGEVTIPIPEKGYGEVCIRLGAQSTYQIACGFDGEAIPVETKVVIVEIDEGTLLVARLDEELPAALPAPKHDPPKRT